MVALSTLGCSALYFRIKSRLKGGTSLFLLRKGVLSPGAKADSLPPDFFNFCFHRNMVERPLPKAPYLIRGFCAVVIKELNRFEPLFDTFSFGMVKDIIEVLHETTIAVSVVTFYIDLFHPDSLFSPPGESNMFLNFCIRKAATTKQLHSRRHQFVPQYSSARVPLASAW